MYLADCQEYLGKVQVLDIRLSQEYMRDVDATYSILEEKDIRPRLLPATISLIKDLWAMP